MGRPRSGAFRFIRQCIAAYLFKLFKNSFMILLRNTNTCIFYARDDLVSLMNHTTNDFTLVGKFYRIGNKVHNHLDQSYPDHRKSPADQCP